MQVLDRYDGVPVLFTVRTSQGQLRLAYRCADTDASEAFLLVPITEAQVVALILGALPLATPFAQAEHVCQLWRDSRTGHLSLPRRVLWALLPDAMRPATNVCLQLPDGPV